MVKVKAKIRTVALEQHMPHAIKDYGERNTAGDGNQASNEDGWDCPASCSTMSPMSQSRSVRRAAMAGDMRTAELIRAKLYQVV